MKKPHLLGLCLLSKVVVRVISIEWWMEMTTFDMAYSFGEIKRMQEEEQQARLRPAEAAKTWVPKDFTGDKDAIKLPSTSQK